MKKENPLDNMGWISLTGNHRHLGIIGEKAAIYDQQVSTFVGLKDESNEAWSELSELAPPGVPLAIGRLLHNPPEKQKDCTLEHRGNCIQMIIEKPITFKEQEFQALILSDVPQMIELMELTDAAPFFPRTIEMGRYIGLKVDDKLVAMGGERLSPAGYVEISAIGTHPDYRRRGLGKAITAALTNEILMRGRKPVLHVWEGNEPAFQLYKKLGYVTRIVTPVWFFTKSHT